MSESTTIEATVSRSTSPNLSSSGDSSLNMGRRTFVTSVPPVGSKSSAAWRVRTLAVSCGREPAGSH